MQHRRHRRWRAPGRLSSAPRFPLRKGGGSDRRLGSFPETMGRSRSRWRIPRCPRSNTPIRRMILRWWRAQLTWRNLENQEIWKCNSCRRHYLWFSLLSLSIRTILIVSHLAVTNIFGPWSGWRNWNTSSK